MTIPQGEVTGFDCRNPFRTQDAGKYGFVDRKLKIITSNKFESAYPFSEHAAVVRLNGKFGFIKENGSWLVEPRLDDAKSFQDGFAIASLDRKFGYINAQGEWIIKPMFDEASQFVNGLAIVVMGGNKSIIDKTGNRLTNTKLRALDFTANRGLLPVQSGKLWGFADVSGTMIIKEQYDAVTHFVRGISWVKLRNTWCPIDRRGRSVQSLPCESFPPIQGFPLRSWPY